MPCASVLITKPVTLSERYFLCAMVFAYLLAGLFLAELIGKKLPAKILAFSLAAFFLFTNALYLVVFSKGQRGHYGAALTFMSENSSKPKATVSSNHDFRDSLVINFYRTRLGLEEKIFYAKASAPDASEAEWFLIQTQDLKFVPPHKNGFELVKSFPHTALSGWTWLVYRRK